MAGVSNPIEVDDPAGCDVFVALTVDGFDATRPSPRWLQLFEHDSCTHLAHAHRARGPS